MQMSKETISTAIRKRLKDFPAEDVLSCHLDGTGTVNDLEKKLKRYYGMRHALCVSSATAGLLGCALALGLRETSFITSPYTYGSSIGSWMFFKNRPIFCDIDPVTLTLDPKAIRRAITTKTRAILVPDIYGVPADSSEIQKLADEYGLWHIADAAQSMGAYRNSHPASVFADALVISFTVGKTIFAGEGGAVLTNNTDLYRKLLWYTQHPRRQRRELGLGLDNEFAMNARIHPLAAVWANATFTDALTRLKDYQKRCFEVIDLMNDSGWIEPIQFQDVGIQPSFFRLTAAWRDRPHPKKLTRQLLKMGIVADVVPPPVRLLYQQPAFLAQYKRCFQRGACPNAERQFERRFALTFAIERNGNKRHPSVLTSVNGNSVTKQSRDVTISERGRGK